MPTPDLSFRPDDLNGSAVVLETGEVMWPREVAPAVVDAISHSGRTVLGLELRCDGDGPTPLGLDTEIPWFDNHGRDAEQSRVAAHEALSRRLDRDDAAYQWVLVTYQD